MRTWATAMAFLLIPGLSAAASKMTTVTPFNLSTQPLHFRITCESYDGGNVRFEVFVTPGSAAISRYRDGRFTIWQEDVGRRQAGDTTPRATLATSVTREDNLEGALHYQIQVHRSLLPKATFTFLNYDSHGMPAFEGYEFILERFVCDE